MSVPVIVASTTSAAATTDSGRLAGALDPAPAHGAAAHTKTVSECA